MAQSLSSVCLFTPFAFGCYLLFVRLFLDARVRKEEDVVVDVDL